MGRLRRPHGHYAANSPNSRAPKSQDPSAGGRFKPYVLLPERQGTVERIGTRTTLELLAAPPLRAARQAAFAADAEKIGKIFGIPEHRRNGDKT